MTRRASRRVPRRTNSRKPNVLLVLVMIAAVVGVASHQLAQNHGIETELAILKNETEQLVRASADTNKLREAARLLAPTAIWHVHGHISEFADCFDCPQMVVIPPGEFTMGSSGHISKASIVSF